MVLSPGSRLGAYEIIELIGVGGMGEVYRARDSRLDRDVAIKTLSSRVTGDATALTRFEREAKAVAALTHPNILAIYDIGAEHGIVFVVTELLEGETLRARLERGPLPWAEAVGIAGEIADGLAATHAKGIIHRDIKPANIFLTTGNHVKILDFGIARVSSAVSSFAETTAPFSVGSTDAGVVLGTVGYMSPEQAKAGSITAASDIFSLGCVLFESLTCRRPFTGGSAIEVLSSILRDDPPTLSISNSTMPPALDDVIRRCLAKKPVDRFESAQDLRLALNQVRQDGPTTASRRRPRPSTRAKSLAVLPFANAGGDSSLEYLSDGITETVINTLAQVSSLRVIARSTAFRYRGKELDAQGIGRELNVEAILTGRLLLMGDTLVIRVELVDVTRGWALWGHQYQRRFEDIFSLQEQIATEISDALKVRLSGAEKKRLAKRYTQNSAAYRLYLEGRYHWFKRTREGLLKAIECFEHAIADDPAYALAHAGIADAYNLLAYYGHMRPIEAWEKAKAAALAGLKIDPLLPEIHTSLGALASAYAWDWKEAARHHEQALQLKANNPTAWFWYAMFQIRQGQVEKAFSLMERALELDPLSLPINVYTGWVMYCARQYDRAANQLRKTLQLDRNFVLTHVHLACVYEQQGELALAIDTFRSALALAPDDVLALKGLGHALAVSGDLAGAQGIVDRLVALSRERAVAEDSVAIVYAAMGRHDEAFAWLDRACDERSPWLIWLHVDPRFDVLRDDPRFAALLARVGLGPKELPADGPSDRQ